MGNYFRQCHEVALIGTRGKIHSQVKNKSMRSVIFEVNHRHSQKPEELQDRLEQMFPGCTGRLEIFARRNRAGWLCLGNDSPLTKGEDIRDSLQDLI
jgi:N6-adenosine-specific RNA methylase IME4